MSAAVVETAETSERPRSVWGLFARHQVASFVATASDFAVMTLLVELAWLSPALGTLCGAAVGACTNFYLNRTFTFETAADGRLPAEGARYALVSGTSALLNAGGVSLGTAWFGASYLIVRVVVSLLVSVGWNFPMHRSFVFRRTAGAAAS